MSEDSPQGVVNPKTVAASASDDPPHGRDSAKDPASVTGAPAGEEVHAWLCHRMEMIRAEQQTLWQKILTTVRSKVTGNL